MHDTSPPDPRAAGTLRRCATVLAAILAGLAITVEPARGDVVSDAVGTVAETVPAVAAPPVAEATGAIEQAASNSVAVRTVETRVGQAGGAVHETAKAVRGTTREVAASSRDTVKAVRGRARDAAASADAGPAGAAPVPADAALVAVGDAGQPAAAAVAARSPAAGSAVAFALAAASYTPGAGHRAALTHDSHRPAKREAGGIGAPSVPDAPILAGASDGGAPAGGSAGLPAPSSAALPPAALALLPPPDGAPPPLTSISLLERPG